MSTSNSTISVRVKLKATLGKYRPAPTDHGAFDVELPAGSTVGDLVDRLGVPRRMVKLVFVEHTRRPFDDPLADGQQVEVFPPIAGG